MPKKQSPGQGCHPSIAMATFVMLSVRVFADEAIASPFSEQRDIKSETLRPAALEGRGALISAAVGEG